jgi:opacity protein-like surface antigen
MTPRLTRPLVLALAVLAGTASAANAQRPANPQRLEAHGFADLGVTVFTAKESFKAVLGSSTGIVFGGGGGVVLPQQFFVDLRASRFKKNGTRVVVADGQTFDLGIANTITITPLEVTGGYRFGRTRDSLRPYAGGGVSWYKYEEADAFATSSEGASETFTGFHVVGGAEFRVLNYFGVAGEAEWARVPDALGQQPGSVALAFGETDLGGTTFRIKLIIGR